MTQKFQQLLLALITLYSGTSFAYSIGEFVEDVKEVGGEISTAWKALVCNDSWCFTPGISIYDCSKNNGNIAACNAENNCYYSYIDNQCKPNGAFPDDATPEEKYAYSLEFLNTWPEGYYRVSGSIYYSSGMTYCGITQEMHAAIGSPFVTDISAFPPSGRVGDICESANPEFIQKVYLKVLNRLPSDEEMAHARVFLGGGIAQTQEHSLEDLQNMIYVELIYSEVWKRKPTDLEYSDGIIDIKSMGYSVFKSKVQVRYIYNHIWGREPSNEELVKGMEEIDWYGFTLTMQNYLDQRTALLVIVSGILFQ